MKKLLFLFILIGFASGNIKADVSDLSITIQQQKKIEPDQSMHLEKFQSLNSQHLTEQEQIQAFLRPVHFSRVGIESFFTKTFNTSLYSERFLPSCFIHVVDFLEYGSQNDKPPLYFESVFNLFHQRLKESTWVNPYALISFFERLPEFLEFLPEQQDQELKNTIKEELEAALLKKFSVLKSDPDLFLDQTAEILMNSVKRSENNSSIKNLQNSVVRFLEGAINKLVWNPHDKIDVWSSVKLIAKKCELLYYYGIIGNMDDVNQLIWSLLYRFGYFIDCAGSQLKYSFYHTVRGEIKTQNLSFLNIVEQEEWLTKKSDYLTKILTEGEIKSHAYDQGILSDFRL